MSEECTLAIVVSLQEDLSKLTLTNRIVLGVELVKSMEGVTILRMQVQSIEVI